MNQETINKHKEIIANAPDDATHCDNVTSYYRVGALANDWCIWKGCWCVSVGCNTMRMPASMRLLQDLKDIVELWESNQWISVEDKLPENDDDVLVSMYGDSVTKLSYNPWDGECSKQWFGEQDIPNYGSERYPVMGVTHWKPLPDAQKE